MHALFNGCITCTIVTTSAYLLGLPRIRFDNLHGVDGATTNSSARAVTLAWPFGEWTTFIFMHMHGQTPVAMFNSSV